MKWTDFRALRGLNWCPQERACSSDEQKIEIALRFAFKDELFITDCYFYFRIVILSSGFEIQFTSGVMDFIRERNDKASLCSVIPQLRGTKRFLVLSCASLVALAAAAQTGQIGYKAAQDADSKKTLLLKDFHPQPMLHLPAHEVKRAKFPVIDVHTHTNDAMGIGDRVDPAKFVEMMDRDNIKMIVILTGLWGDKLQGVIRPAW